jgi:hypothetical protein
VGVKELHPTAATQKMWEMSDDAEPPEADPASYEYWRASGYRGRPPWRRGYRLGYLAISLALAALIAGLLWLLVHSA